MAKDQAAGGVLDLYGSADEPCVQIVLEMGMRGRQVPCIVCFPLAIKYLLSVGNKDESDTAPIESETAWWSRVPAVGLALRWVGPEGSVPTVEPWNWLLGPQSPLPPTTPAASWSMQRDKWAGYKTGWPSAK